MLQPVAVREPILELEPEYLDFGVIDTRSIQNSIKVIITNNGGSILIGRLIPQVSWITISPPQFKCSGSQSSEHNVTLSAKLPRYWNQQTYSFSNLLLLNSNVGSIMIGGSYTISQRSPSIQSMPPKKIFLIPVITIILLALMISSIMVFSNSSPNQPSANSEISILFTQGASTEFVRLTQKALDGPANSVALSSNENALQPKEEAFLFTVTPKPTGFPTSTPEPTFTPWPRELYQNPEQFIRDYYDAINSRNYQQSWSMLTQNFKEQCCSQSFGTEPFYVYTKWWETIDKVEVRSAYLQAWDKNPAQVVASLRFYSKDENIRDIVQVYSIISDVDKMTLLINEAQ